MIRQGKVGIARGLLVLACALAASGARAGEPTTATIVAFNGNTTTYGEESFRVRLSAACPLAPGSTFAPAFEGSVTIRLGGVPWQKLQGPTLGFCQDGVTWADLQLRIPVPIGTHLVAAEYDGNGTYDPARAASVSVTVRPHFSGEVVAEGPRVDAGLAYPDPASHERHDCRINAAALTPAANVPAPAPAGVVFPYGLFQFELGNCSRGSDFSPAPPLALVQRVSLRAPEALPAGSSLWAYGPRVPGGFPEWYRLATEVFGRSADANIPDGGDGDQTGAGDGLIRGVIALAVPKVLQIKITPEGLWWAGPQENGWGMSIARTEDRLFNTFFVYDADGRAEWIVMPGGTWDATFTSFTGSLYIPGGTWFGRYDASRLAVGDPVGTATLTFSSSDAATLTYTVRGASGTKIVQRQVFDTTGTIAGNFAGLWWGGAAQNGWGLSIAQQGDTLFNVWYTYDAAGHAAWYVMPGGSWITPRTYSGPLYRTRGSRWADRTYDPSQLVVERVGTMTIAFDSQNDAYLTYVIDGVEQTRSITRQPF